MLNTVLAHLTRIGTPGERVLPACAAALKEGLCLDVRTPCMPAQKAAWEVDLVSGVVVDQLQVQASAFTSVSVHTCVGRFHVVRAEPQHACLPPGDPGGDPCCRGACAATAASLACLLRRRAGACSAAWSTQQTRAPARSARWRSRRRGSRRRGCTTRCRARPPSRPRTPPPRRRASPRLWSSSRPSSRCVSQPCGLTECCSPCSMHLQDVCFPTCPA